MKIALYDPYLDTMSGGEKYMLSIATALSHEHEVSIFWPTDQKEVICKKAIERFGLDLQQLRFVPSLFSPQVSLLSRMEQSRNYDLIILLSDGSIPVVACSLILHFQSPMNWVKGRSFKNQLKLRRVKEIVVNSQFTKKYIDTLLAKKAKVLYPPVTIKGNYDPTSKTKMLLNVGRFGINQAGSSFKKQDVLADAFVKMYMNGRKDWSLVFVMTVMDNDRGAFENFQKKYSAYPISFLVNPTSDVLWKTYEAASIYWHASGFGEDLSLHPDRAEHFGISTVEAMGAGAVPVVYKAGGQVEIVNDQENGRLWTTVDELIDQTNQLIEDKNQRESLASHAIKSVDKFSLEEFNKQVNVLVT